MRLGPLFSLTFCLRAGYREVGVATVGAVTVRFLLPGYIGAVTRNRVWGFMPTRQLLLTESRLSDRRRVEPTAWRAIGSVWRGERSHDLDLMQGVGGRFLRAEVNLQLRKGLRDRGLSSSCQRGLSVIFPSDVDGLLALPQRLHYPH